MIVSVAWAEGADESLPLPAYRSAGAAGADLCANLPGPARAGGVTIPPGGQAWSDPVALSLPGDAASPLLAGRKLAVSLHLPGQTGPMTWHAKAMQTSYLSPPGAGSRGAEEGEAVEADGMITVGLAGGPETPIAWPGAPDPAAAISVADAGLAVDAAAAGLGRVTVPELIARADLLAGRVVALGEARPSAKGYWLVAPLPQWRQKKVRALVEALGA